jgi:hypothetical protein
MAGPEDDISESEKRRILREQASTMHQHAVAWAGEISQGRFAANGTPSVTGATAIPYSSLSEMPASSPWSGQQPQPGPEPPLGFDNPALESSAASILPVEDTGDPVAAPSTGIKQDSPDSSMFDSAAGSSLPKDQSDE